MQHPRQRSRLDARNSRNPREAKGDGEKLYNVASRQQEGKNLHFFSALPLSISLPALVILNIVQKMIFVSLFHDENQGFLFFIF